MSHGASQVRFRNHYGKKIYVAYMRRDFSCQADSGEPWEVRGWINLDPWETEYRANPDPEPVVLLLRRGNRRRVLGRPLRRARH
jgi:hypothetical protein